MKFNTKTNISNKTDNLAGGESFKESPKLALISLLLTSFVKDQYYRTADESLVELTNLIDAIPDKRFVAKSAIYARNQFGMRSVSHAIAGFSEKIFDVMKLMEQDKGALIAEIEKVEL